MVRSFLAINLSHDARAAIGNAVRNWRYLGRSVRWVKESNIHLTIKFLGDIPSSQVKDVSSAVKQLCSDLEPFTLELDRPGVFPDLRRPRVLWIGLKGPADSLAGVQNLVEETLFLQGFPKEKRLFIPHITVGRIKGRPPSSKSLARFLKTDLPSSKSAIDRLCLYKSVLTPSGPVYTPLGVYPFQNKSS